MRALLRVTVVVIALLVSLASAALLVNRGLNLGTYSGDAPKTTETPSSRIDSGSGRNAQPSGTPDRASSLRGNRLGRGSIAPGEEHATSLDYAFPVAGCRTRYASTHHHYPAADIFGDKRCTFVAPVGGRIDEVARRDRWQPSTNDGATRGGRFVSLVGEDGVRYYGSHLASVRPDVHVGRRVRAGEPLGLLGQSGSARGTGIHLHFGLSWPTERGNWWIRRGVVAPQPFLDAWSEGRGSSPAKAVSRKRATAGEETSCRNYC